MSAAAARLGYKELKDKQKEALRAFVSGKDVFVSLTTGYGKSLCYQSAYLSCSTLFEVNLNDNSNVDSSQGGFSVDFYHEGSSVSLAA